jgi:Holliday junction resolvase RusA-like endonuclease
MIQQFTAPIPPTLNEQINLNRTHWAKGAKSKQINTDIIAGIALANRLKPFPGKVWIDFHWQVKSYANDPDNVAAASKFIMDGLTKAGILTKDSLMIIQSPVVNRYSKGDNTVTVTIADHPIWEMTIASEELRAIA